MLKKLFLPENIFTKKLFHQQLVLINRVQNVLNGQKASKSVQKRIITHGIILADYIETDYPG